MSLILTLLRFSISSFVSFGYLYLSIKVMDLSILYEKEINNFKITSLGIWTPGLVLTFTLSFVKHFISLGSQTSHFALKGTDYITFKEPITKRCLHIMNKMMSTRTIADYLLLDVLFGAFLYCLHEFFFHRHFIFVLFVDIILSSFENIYYNMFPCPLFLGQTARITKKTHFKKQI